jgi:hypothetical protein
MLTALAHSHFTSSLLPRATVTLEIDWRNMQLCRWYPSHDLSVLTVGCFNLCFEWSAI